jgi:hypothetical protein
VNLDFCFGVKKSLALGDVCSVLRYRYPACWDIITIMKCLFAGLEVWREAVDWMGLLDLWTFGAE